ncbi:MAG: tape measure protein [Cypionkella sp.]|nr:tape measure protein [Cypionkella sp.]
MTEFDQINEGGLRPLLQVAANTERFGGSVSKLRAELGNGALTGKQFFDLILAGSAQLDAQASKATLTLAGAFLNLLPSRLTVWSW